MPASSRPRQPHISRRALTVAVTGAVASAVTGAVATSAVVGMPAHAATPQGPAPASLRLLSYNIHHGAGLDGVLDLERIAGEIEATGADVIGLQEVDNHWGARSDWMDQASWLATRLGMHHAYAANLDLDPVEGDTVRRQYGTAVLSRFPILSAQNHLLTSIPYPTRPTEQRGLLHVVVNVHGAHVDINNTHLDHQRAEQRISQVTEVLGIVGGQSGTAVVLGDLNATPEAAEVRMLTDGRFVDAFAGIAEADTYPAEAPTKRIDYLLVREGLAISGQEVLATEASDHLPIVATLTVQRPQR